MATPSMDGFEWQNTPSMSRTVSLAVGPETRIGFCVFCSMDIFSVTKHFLRIPIRNVVSLERMFGVSAPMTSVGVSRLIHRSPSRPSHRTGQL